MSEPAIATLLLTGAAGRLGQVLTAPLAALCGTLVLSDLPQALPKLAQPLPANARVQGCDLADAGAVLALLQGVDAVLHLGGISVEGPWQPILQANVMGSHNLYEAARRQGVPRIVQASSNHVTGCYPRSQRISPQDPPRPDGNYGLSKMFGEGLASLYWQRHGIQSVCLRIGTATPTPPDLRGLCGWLSPRDMLQLVTRALLAPDVGCLVAYGCSDNTRSWWHAQEAWQRLGYQPQDNSEAHAPAVQHLVLPPGPQTELQGGAFVAWGPYDDPAA